MELDIIQLSIADMVSGSMCLFAFYILLRPNRFFRYGAVIYLLLLMLHISTLLIFSEQVKAISSVWWIPYYLFALSCFDNPWQEIVAMAAVYSCLGGLMLMACLLPIQLMDFFAVYGDHSAAWFASFMGIVCVSPIATTLLMYRFQFWRKLPRWTIAVMLFVSCGITAFWDLVGKPFADFGLVARIDIALLLSCLCSFVISIYSERKRNAQRVAYLERQQHTQQQYYRMLKEEGAGLIRFRDSLLEKIDALKATMAQGDAEKTTTVIDGLAAYVQSMKVPFSSGHGAVDAILQSKYSIAKQKSCTMQVSISLREGCGVSDMDIICVLSNLLDNALHAAKAGDCIVVRGAQQSGLLVLEVRNPAHGDQTLPKDFDTPSPSADGHGIGLASVQRTVSRYDGSLSLNVENGVVCARVLLEPLESCADKPV